MMVRTIRSHSYAKRSLRSVSNLIDSLALSRFGAVSERGQNHIHSQLEEVRGS